jgi:hypothetical protein
MSEHGSNHDVQFEKSDVDASALLKYGFVLVVTTAVVIVLLWRLYFVFVRQEAARQPPPPVLKADAEAMAAPPPNLQVRPVQDFQAFRAREVGVLESYGWVDKDKGVVRIPIDEAMRLIAERGLPPTPQSAPAVAAPAKPAVASTAAKEAKR